MNCEDVCIVTYDFVCVSMASVAFFPLVFDFCVVLLSSFSSFLLQFPFAHFCLTVRISVFFHSQTTFMPYLCFDYSLMNRRKLSQTYRRQVNQSCRQHIYLLYQPYVMLDKIYRATVTHTHYVITPRLLTFLSLSEIDADDLKYTICFELETALSAER